MSLIWIVAFLLVLGVVVFVVSEGIAGFASLLARAVRSTVSPKPRQRRDIKFRTQLSPHVVRQTVANQLALPKRPGVNLGLWDDSPRERTLVIRYGNLAGWSFAAALAILTDHEETIGIFSVPDVTKVDGSIRDLDVINDLSSRVESILRDFDPSISIDTN